MVTLPASAAGVSFRQVGVAGSDKFRQGQLVYLYSNQQNILFICKVH